MSTVVGFESAEGVVLAGDRYAVRGGRVVGRERPHVFDLGVEGYGVAAVGDDLDGFERRVDAELRRYRTEREEPSVEAFAQLVAGVTEETAVDAIVAARADDGTAHIRTVDRDGSVLVDEFAARGTGANFALGRLEAADRDVGLDEAVELARETVETVARRDALTGETVDVWRLAGE